MPGQITLNDLVDFGHLELLAKKVVEGYITGLHKSPYHGFSVEFAEHRPYNTGESIRHIDWKLFARTEKLFIKKYEEETNLRCRIIVDVSSSMYYPFEGKERPGYNKYSFSALASACLMNLLQRQRDAVGLTLIDENIRFHSQARSSITHIRNLIAKLENYLLTPPKKPINTQITELLHELAEKIHARSLVVIFSDFMAGLDPEKNFKEALKPLLDALGHLMFNKHEVILFHVLDASTELDLKFEYRPFEFEDSESGEKIRLNPAEIQKVYQSQAHQFESFMRVESTQMGIDFNMADIGKGLFDILNAFMIKRQTLF